MCFQNCTPTNLIWSKSHRCTSSRRSAAAFHVLMSHDFVFVLSIICVRLTLTVHQWLLDSVTPKLAVRPWKAWTLRLRSLERRWSPEWRAPDLPVPRVRYRYELGDEGKDQKTSGCLCFTGRWSHLCGQRIQIQLKITFYPSVIVLILYEFHLVRNLIFSCFHSCFYCLAKKTT